MASPIASPQNIIALQNMNPEPGWFQWFFVAIPVSVICVIFIWLFLVLNSRDALHLQIPPIRESRDKLTFVQYTISIVTILTIILWCMIHKLEHIFGDMGVVAIIPLVFFFGTGILSKEDFNNFLWTIIVLAMGGIALGKAVASSGLLLTIANSVRMHIADTGIFPMTLIFGALVVIVASFISHTVAALIVLPILAEIGETMNEPHPRLLVMSCALLCSAAMALPTSGFPNMTAIMVENSVGSRYLNVSDFIKKGIPASLIAYLVVCTVGFALMLIMGF